ncbi:MAG: hypothetical protein Q8R39_01620 [bacterium]|nr:hypothetical protein [bacterium]
MEATQSSNLGTVQSHHYHLSGRQVAIVVGIAVLIATAGIGGYVFLKNSLPQPPQLPIIRLWHNGVVYDGVEGSYCWPTQESSADGEFLNLCVDRVFGGPETSIRVPSGDTMSIDVQAYAPAEKVWVTLFQESGERLSDIPVTVGETVSTFVLDTSPGTYVVLVSGAWSDDKFAGDINYSFTVQVVGGTNNEINVDTSGWQTYRNEEFEFEVKYPGGWFNTRNLIEDIREEKLFEFSSEKNFTVDAITLQIVRSESIQSKNLFVDLQNLKPGETFEQDLVVYTKIEDLNIGGFLAIRHTADRSSIPYIALPIRSEILLKRDGTTFLFVFVGSPEIFEHQKIVFDQILSTFRFLEPSRKAFPLE